MTETVSPGKYVEYSYLLTDAATGRKLFEATKSRPDQMIYGVSQDVVPGLASVMEGLKAGDKFEVTLPPAAAFGERNEEDVVELDRQIFERDGKLAEEVKVGAALPMMTAEGYRVVGTVVAIGSKVVMDFNHPFAGLTVTFAGEIETVRDATEEEIHPASGCGGCCHGGGCGDGCGGDEGCGHDDGGSGSCCGGKGGCGGC